MSDIRRRIRDCEWELARLFILRDDAMAFIKWLWLRDIDISRMERVKDELLRSLRSGRKLLKKLKKERAHWRGQG